MDFIQSKVGFLSFKYLGLPVSVNPTKVGTWDPLVQVVTNRLAYWKNRFVSLGERVVLLNLVLNSLPIFFLSFLKMVVFVWKKIVGMQMRFL